MKPKNALNTQSNISKYDDVYEALISAHTGLSIEDSMKLNAKLILFLINHIGDAEVVFEALEKATKTDANVKLE